MRKSLIFLAVGVFLFFGLAGSVNAVVVDFTGGTAYLAGGGTVTPNNSGYWDNVDYYIEDGIRYDFIGGYGIIGDYYTIGLNGPGDPPVLNDVIHAHWGVGGLGSVTSMVITKVDGSTFDLNYVDVTSNTSNSGGGGQQTGAELSYLTNNSAYSMLLPSSDWGFDYDFYGVAGDGVARLWLDSNFNGISSATFTSLNAACFGLDNFYIDEPAPPAVPEPATMLLLGSGLLGLAGLKRKLRKN